MKKPIRFVALVAWSFISLLIPPSSRSEGQTGATSSPAFEVVSIKLNKTVGGEPQRKITPGNFDYTGVSLAEYVKLAFGVTNRQLLGPRWIYEDRYDIAGKAASPAREDEILLMLRTLLMDRFQMKFHRENREAPVYALVVGKDGPTFRASRPDDSPERVLSKDAYVFVKAS
ncbi:MAG TPA: TIGR03435 family protein, partial [Pyrinomonadaceae bacterium]|nr:TIGR03435 family protein [Pyrinomonadaceae bacterium]